MFIQRSVKIEASAKEVFSYLLDIDNRKDYIPLLEEIIMLDPLPIRKGSRYIEIAEIKGRRLETTYQVVELKENQYISAKTLESVFPIQVDLLLREEKGKSDLTIQLDFQLKGVFKLASRIVKGIVDQQAKSILQQVKNNIEQEEA